MNLPFDQIERKNFSFDIHEQVNLRIALLTAMRVLSEECLEATREGDVDLYNEKHLLKNDRLAQKKFLEIVPIFSSKSEKDGFWNYAHRHFYQIRPKYTCDMLPPFVEHINNGQCIDALKDEYLDAMACVNMLKDYRMQANTDTKTKKKGK